jgi:predicted nuclease with TOPRIM domain
MRGCKDKLKTVTSESAELDEEIKFLLQQIDFADEQHEKLEDRIDTLREGNSYNQSLYMNK